MLGREDGGLRGISVSESGYNEVLALEVLNVVDCVESKRRAELPASESAPCAVAAVPSFQACLRAYICTFVCVCVYMCICVCVRTCIYVCICMCVCICICMHLYTCVYVCECIFVHRLWVSVSVLQRADGVMHAHVYSCAYVCVCICV